MTRRSLPALLLLGAILALADLHPAWGQQPPPAVQGLDKLTPEERAIAERNLEKWQRLTPEERARALARTLAPSGVVSQQELQQAYERYQRLPQERRDRIQQRLGQWESMTPEERDRVLRNQERWRQMSPDERERIRERWRQMPPEERERLRQQRQQRRGPQ